MSDVKPVYIKVADIPRLYSLSRDTIYRYARKGFITIHKGTGSSLVKVADLENLIEGKAA